MYIRLSKSRRLCYDEMTGTIAYPLIFAAETPPGTSNRMQETDAVSEALLHTACAGSACAYGA